MDEGLDGWRKRCEGKEFINNGVRGLFIRQAWLQILYVCVWRGNSEASMFLHTFCCTLHTLESPPPSVKSLFRTFPSTACEGGFSFSILECTGLGGSPRGGKT